MNYYISDTHFLHARILDFCKLSRPFKNADEMNEFMINEWNSVVTNKDTVYHLGDFAFGSGTTFEDAENIFNRLNGHKHLIIGNHEAYGLKLNWESKVHYRKIREAGDNKVILCHYPIEDWEARFHGSYHFHGHVHTSKHAPFRFMKNRYDVGVDNIGFKPKTFKEIIDNH